MRKNSPTKPLIVIIGAASFDVIGLPSTDLQDGSSIAGEAHISYGGVARNIAENLSSLGQPVSLISVVGEDEFGIGLLAHLTEKGVDISGCRRCPTCRTGVYMAIVSADGSRTFALADRQNMKEISSQHLESQEQLFEKAGFIFFDANILPAAIRTVLKISRRHNIPIGADPASVMLTSRLKNILPHLDLITPNSREAAAILGWDHEPGSQEETMLAARELVERGVKTVIIPMGERGVCYATSETSGQIPSILTKIVDPTGAGDALTSVVLYGLLNDLSIDDSVRLGVSAASITLRRFGSVVPDLDMETIYENLVI